ncbi:MAG: DUF4271 domain-containing protein [Dysgonamonadaceae bacterium]|nr:DUF4271 domain-containing protein [Dysgonamonadaceae bacterium]
MFENPVDTIIVTDTIPYSIVRDSVNRISDSDSLSFAFSENNAFQTDSIAFVGTVNDFSSGFSGKPFAESQFWGSIFFILFTLSLLLFSMVFRSGGASLTGNFKNLFSFGNRKKTVYKEQITTSEAWGGFFLLSQAALNISMVAFIGFWNMGISSMTLNMQFLLFGGMLLSFALFLSIKYGVCRLIGFILPELEMDDWIEKYIWGVEVLGIFSFLPSLFFIYLPEYREIALILLLIIIFISFVAIFGNLLTIFVKNKIGFLYFIVYLCAVEIAPLFVLYRGVVLLINHAGIIL